MKDFLFLFLYLVPRNAISMAFGWLARRHWPVFSKAFRNVFARIYGLDMAEAEKPIYDYPNVHELFIRRLQPGARPVDSAEIVSPVDGKVSMHGLLDDTALTMIQAKGRTYSLSSLVGSEELASRFSGGIWGVIYLAPWNYHRIHSPAAGKLTQAIYLPGTLWPVNDISVRKIPELFCVNERVVSLMELETGGKLLLIKVGATNVGRISLSYTSEILSNAGRTPSKGANQLWTPSQTLFLDKAGELACFELGSTVVLVGDSAVRARHPHLFKSWLGRQVRMGQGL